MVYLVIIALTIFVIAYRLNTGKSTYKFIYEKTAAIYERVAPYSYKAIRDKVKVLGLDFTKKQYVMQLVFFSLSAIVISYLYFYSIIFCIIYALAAMLVVPYLAYLRYKKIYSDFVFEQIQVYTTNVIMEFQTTKSFVKALEGVSESGVLEDPVQSDVKEMINIAYDEGVIDNAIKFFNDKYNYHIVKNMHQLFIQITREGAKNTDGSLENMLLDIDMLVEGVYRDRIERATFHKTFIQFGIMLYLLIMLVQFLLGSESYLLLLENIFIQLVLHGIVIINSYFILSGEKFYYENVGAE